MRYILIALLIISLSTPILFGVVKIFYVSTSSMNPSIKQGSYVFVGKSQIYKLGDVISFKSNNGQVITHRIDKIEQLGQKVLLTTKGDANTFVDSEKVSIEEIVGKVFFILPYLGSIISFLTSYKTIGFIFYLPMGFLLGKTIKHLYSFFI